MAKRYPHQLSGGQQQRVALARALVVEPAVLLLDEPLSALDAKVRVGLREEIRRLQLQLGMTTLFVTHDQEEALSISDRIGVMSNGRLEQLGTPRAVYAEPANAFVARFVGRLNELPGRVDGSAVEVAGVRIEVAPPGRRRERRRRHLDVAPGGRAGPGIEQRRLDRGRAPGHRRERALRRLVEPAPRPPRPTRPPRRRPGRSRWRAPRPGDRVVVELRPAKVRVVAAE